MNSKNQKLDFTLENIGLLNILSKQKIAIIKHPASKKILIGAKTSGKTFLAEIDILHKFENDNYFNAWGLRYFKYQATEKLADYFFASIRGLKDNGINLKYRYKQAERNQKIIRLRVKTNPKDNQSFSFASMENSAASTGTKPSNNGYVGICLIDEPLVERNIIENKIPTKKEFNKYQSMLESDMDRHHASVRKTYGVNPYKFTIYYTLNPWGEHPITKRANIIIPEKEFIDFIFYDPINEITFDQLLENQQLIEFYFSQKHNLERFKNNNTLAKYDEESDELYVRMTKFANPNNLDDYSFKQSIFKIKNSLLFRDYSGLCIFLGITDKPNINEEMLAFNIPNFNNCHYTKMLKDNYYPVGICYAVDIDTSRVFTITPSIAMRKKIMIGFDKWKYDYKIFVDRQIEIPARGTGIVGELNNVYVKYILEIVNNHFKRRKLFDYELIDSAIILDDKRKQYVFNVMENKPDFIKNVDTFKQHGEFGISNRQDWLELGFRNKKIINHSDNVKLENDIKYCLRADIQNSKRQTTGTLNYLDRIDSMENSVIYFLSIILS